ncbi:MAG: aminotransferase class I/II-fold pyridoxal phosphate-dependent enzyme [Polyangiaceae bacterium]
MSRLPTGTDAVHGASRAHHAHHAVAPPIVQTATFAFDDTADLRRFMSGADPDSGRTEYARNTNPTVRAVEQKIAALDGAEDALLFASGMAAITTSLLALVKAGDHVVLFRDAYRKTRLFVAKTLARFGVEHTLVDPCDLDALERALRPRTRLVVTELPTNPYLRCIDLPRLARTCRAARAKTLVDATFATPMNVRPLDHGIDLVAHSATKYLAGHNDVLGGTVSGSESLVSLIRELRSEMGPVTDPHAAALIGRGIKTLALRVARQNDTALAVARALEGHPEVERVYYPLLESHPDHAVARSLLRGGGGVVSFVVRGGREAAARAVDRFQLATIAASLGGTETLVEPHALLSYADLDDDALAAAGIAPGLVRLSVGVEETADITADVLRALTPTIAEAPTQTATQAGTQMGGQMAAQTPTKGGAE